MTYFNLKSPFGGMTQWIYQRFTAIFMLIYLIIILFLSLQNEGGFQGWMAMMSPLWMKILTTLFFYLMMIHAFIGVIHVTDDYISNLMVRKILNIFFFSIVLIQIITLPYILFGVVN